MKIKQGFELKEIAENFVAVPTSENVVDFSSIIMLNETGAFIWQSLVNDKTIKDLVGELTAIYDVSEEIATKDVKKIIDELNNAGVIEGIIE